jgi:flagellar hook-length control protein FliK
MTAIASTNALETQVASTVDPAKLAGTDIFNALLGTIAPAPSSDRTSAIGRKGAPAAQQRSFAANPLSSINPTDAAVAQMSTKGPAKATVAAAEQDSTTPRHGDAAQAPRRPVQTSPVREPAASQSSPDNCGKSTATAGPNAATPVNPTGVAAASSLGVVAARAHANPPATRATNSISASSPLARLIHPTMTRGAERAQVTPRAILRPVVAQHAQGRSSAKAATPPQSPTRPEDPEAEFASQLSRGFSAILRQNGGSLTLHLQPQDLGEMTIRMDLTPGKVTAAFEVESDQARQLLNENLSTLRSALEARGLGVDSLTVHVSERSAQDAPTRAEPESSSGGANPDGGARGHSGGSGTDRPHAETLDARSAHESLPEAGAPGVDTGGAQLIRLALDAVA